MCGRGYVSVREGVFECVGGGITVFERCCVRVLVRVCFINESKNWESGLAGEPVPKKTSDCYNAFLSQVFFPFEDQFLLLSRSPRTPPHPLSLYIC